MKSIKKTKCTSMKKKNTEGFTVLHITRTAICSGVSFSIPKALTSAPCDNKLTTQASRFLLIMMCSGVSPWLLPASISAPAASKSSIV